PIARGKPRTMLNLNPDGQYAIGVHLDPAVLTYVLSDLTGQTREHTRHATPAEPDPDTVTAQITDQIEALIVQSGIARSKIVGVGLAAPGPIDVDRGVVIDPPNLAGWQAVPL